MNLNFLQVLVMAIIQGLTEFLPISSSGHLVVVTHLLKGDAQAGMFLTVMLNVGTLLVIFIAFKKDVTQLGLEFKQMLVDIVRNAQIFIRNKKDQDALRYHKVLNSNYRKFATMILVSIIPTIIIGLLLRPLVVKFTGSLLATGAGLFITTVFLLVVNFTKAGDRTPLDIDYKIALIIGFCQGFAVLPGVSRVGITIATCLLCGFTCKFAVKYTFILAIPTIVGAAIMTIATAPKDNINAIGVIYCIVGIIFTTLIGVVCVRFMLKLVKKHNLKYFAGYCFIIGVIAIIYNFI